MIVGATELIESIGTGAPTRIDSSKKMNCSIAVRPWPPYSSGQPMPAQPSVAICFQILRGTGPMPSPVRELGLDLRREQLGVVVPQLVAQSSVSSGVRPMYMGRPLIRRPDRGPGGQVIVKVFEWALDCRP